MKEHCNDFKETNVIGTAIYCCSESEFMGDIVFADIIKQDSKDALKALKKLGIAKTVMMTGDKEEIAKDIASKAGIDTVYSRLMPDEKANIVSELQKSGSTVVYTGDGINDARILRLKLRIWLLWATHFQNLQSAKRLRKRLFA